MRRIDPPTPSEQKVNISRRFVLLLFRPARRTHPYHIGAWRFAQRKIVHNAQKDSLTRHPNHPILWA